MNDRSTDESLRQGVTQNLEFWIQKLECSGDVEKQQTFKRQFIEKLKKSKIAIETDAANEQHYEVPTDFFKIVLGKRLKYSSALWPEGTKSLDEAENAMLQLVCDRAKLTDGQVVLDLGCGWGATALYILEKYPHSQVVCVSNSQTQKAFIEHSAYEQGFASRINCITSDANFFNTDQRFDRIISIEMFEHMKNYEQLFSKVASWLKPAGLLFTQILCHRQFPYNFDSRRTSDTEWMARNFFSGGTMPSSDLFLYFQNDVVCEDHWIINGRHYSQTLEAWLRKLDQNIEQVRRVFTKAYGASETEKQIFNWRLFFIFCSEVFGFRNGNEWMVSHHLFRKRISARL